MIKLSSPCSGITSQSGSVASQCNYASLCDFSLIREGYRLAHRGKSEVSEVIDFDEAKGFNLRKLQKSMFDKKWSEIFEYYNFMIHEPKERVVDALTFRGRIMQHVLCDNILKPFFEPRLIKDNCACRVGKGTDYAVNLVTQGMTKFYRKHKNNGYVLKVDVRKFFPSIDREILKKMLSKFPDKEVLELVYFLIDSAPGDSGIPIGNQTSQWFALYYLDKLDRIVKEKYRIKYYVRYMDDLIIIHESKEYLQQLLADLAVAADKLKLSFNGKTQITPLKRGFCFLGWRFYYSDTGKIVKRIANEKRKHRVKTIKNMTTKEQEVSIVNYLKRGNTFRFMKSYGLFYTKKVRVKMDKGFSGKIIGTIRKIDKYPTKEDSITGGYISISAGYQQQAIVKVYGEDFTKIFNNFTVGNLVEVEGDIALNSNNKGEKSYTGIEIRPRSITRLAEREESTLQIKV